MNGATPRQLGAVVAALRDAGAKPMHLRRLLRQWACALDAPGGPSAPEHSLPKTLRAAWDALLPELRALAVLRSRHAGQDGGERLLLGLADSASVETVLLPGDGLCVSTQVGCAVGCAFCMTGRDGLARQLGSAEIVAQVALARTLRPVRGVVFMGMGEPAHNLDAVMEAITLLGTEGAIGHKAMVFSTVGDRRAFARLPQGPVKPALALSLHTTKPELRQRLLPRAPLIEPAELVDLADAYARAVAHPVQVQWTLLEGVNDGDDEVQALAALMRGRRAMVNLIPFNRVDGLPWRRPTIERAAAMAAALSRRGVLTRLRRSAAQDVEGGCGQLRAREAAPRPAALRPLA